MHHFLAFALCLALWPSMAEAKNPIPEGEYVIVDTLHGPSINAGLSVPIYVHVTSRGDTLDVAFITSFRPDSRSCERRKNCERIDKALELDLAEDAGRIVIEEGRTILDDVIERPDADLGLIVAPVRIFIDGAAVSIGDDPSIPNGVTLTKRDGRKARLIPASIEFTEAAIDFTQAMEQPRWRTKTCLVRQMATMAARHDRSAEHNAFLGAVALVEKLYDSSTRWDARDPLPEKGSDAWRKKILASMIRRAIHSPPSDDPAEEVRILEPPLEEIFQNWLGTEYDSVVAETFGGKEQSVRAYRVWNARIKTLRDAHPKDPAAIVEQLCEDITLSKIAVKP